MGLSFKYEYHEHVFKMLIMKGQSTAGEGQNQCNSPIHETVFALSVH